VEIILTNDCILSFSVTDEGAFSINISSVKMRKKTQCFKAGLVLTFHQAICKTYLKFTSTLISEFVLLTNSLSPVLSWKLAKLLQKWFLASYVKGT